ncbi:MAG: SUMF1/EgtB/PvdO family nonheme iron enzyme [Thermoguttaceae bacterium]|nr:SUMF1/EgtB/PvdO family nonheme iron enzyme [Thermoguttaceae bacterium]
MSKPYWDSLNEGVKSLESVDNQDWNRVIESLEGLVNIHPRLIPLMAKEMENPWKTISLQLKLSKELNDFDVKVFQQRLMNVIEKCPEEVKHHFPDIEETIRKTKAESLYKQAVELHAKKQHKEAFAKINEALALDPGNSDYQKEKKIIESSIDPFSTEGRKAGDRVVKVINGVEFAFIWCPAGTFMMGSPSSESGRDNDETQHQVTLTKGFWMMETEVTQKQWKAVMGNNPSNFKGDDLPVESVSWNDCQEFCKKCTQLGLPVQLPTEAQWEYACRAGTTGAYSGNLDEMAWYWDNSNKTTHSVGTKKPNAWGLYDMHGNVWEWCQDWKADYPSGSVTDPAGPSSGSVRVIRGGSWCYIARFCRSAIRYSSAPDNRDDLLGFRCVKGQ